MEPPPRSHYVSLFPPGLEAASAPPPHVIPHPDPWALPSPLLISMFLSFLLVIALRAVPGCYPTTPTVNLTLHFHEPHSCREQERVTNVHKPRHSLGVCWTDIVIDAGTIQVQQNVFSMYDTAQDHGPCWSSMTGSSWSVYGISICTSYREIFVWKNV